jgi:hypothetical protein
MWTFCVIVTGIIYRMVTVEHSPTLEAIFRGFSYEHNQPLFDRRSTLTGQLIPAHVSALLILAHLMAYVLTARQAFAAPLLAQVFGFDNTY